MRRALCAAFLIGAIARPVAAAAQTVIGEAAVAAGHSTQADTSAAATQVRLFGDVTPALRFFAEGTWARTSNSEVDAFGTAYPYRNRGQVMEAYAEWVVSSGGRVLGLKGGRYRMPFGISSGSDHAYTGFLRAPLIRYDGYFALSNNFLEHGVTAVAGVPRLTVEGSLGAPADVGVAQRRRGVDAVVRVQHHTGPLIVGASVVRTLPYQSPRFARGHAIFGGVDARWMRGGLQLRGEWLGGRPFDGTTTTGWYADVILHRVGMGPVTALARLERLDYDANPPFDLHATRQIIGTRVRLVDGLAVQANFVGQTGAIARTASTALDVGIVYSIRRD
jgi:hypothetical protein